MRKKGLFFQFLLLFLLCYPHIATSAVDKTLTVEWWYSGDTPDFYVLYQEGIPIAEFYVIDLLESTTPATLQDGENIFTMTASIAGIETAQSAPYIVNWPPLSYTISITCGSGGTTLPAGPISAEEHTDQIITILPDTNYHVSSILDNSESVATTSPYTIEDILTDHSLTIAFALDTYTITTSAGTGGSISCTATTVEHGGSSTCTATGDNEHNVSAILADGSPTSNPHTFSNVTANHTIAATFTLEISTFSFSDPTGKPVTGDWDGDGTTEVGTVVANKWYLDYDGDRVWNVAVDKTYTFGSSLTIPITGDWNGDGKTEIGAVLGNTWYIDFNGNGLWDNTPTDKLYTFGNSSTTPVSGDWDNDGVTEIGAELDGIWYLDSNGNGIFESGIDMTRTFGNASTIPITGDWDGDGTTEIGYFSDGSWHIDVNNNGIDDDSGYSGIGTSSDKPITGDWDGDGTTEIGYFNAGSWSIQD